MNNKQVVSILRNPLDNNADKLHQALNLACERLAALDELPLKVSQALKGLDMEENEEGVGYWETSAGATFGANKLREVIDLIIDKTGEGG